MTANAAIGNQDNAAFLWYSDDTLYVPDLSSPPGNALAAFNTATEDWSFLPVTGDEVRLKSSDSDSDHRSSEMSASIPSSGLAFSFGDFAQLGLVKFDGSVPRALTWQNQTSGGSQGIQVPLVSEAEMVYVPLGKQGVLLVMGGMDVRLEVPPSSEGERREKKIHDLIRHGWCRRPILSTVVPWSLYLKSQFTTSNSAPGSRSQHLEKSPTIVANFAL